jgi:hypothetical protein
MKIRSRRAQPLDHRRLRRVDVAILEGQHAQAGLAGDVEQFAGRQQERRIRRLAERAPAASL